MLIPTYMPDQGQWDDLPVVQSLKENGLFHVIRPKEHVGEKETQELATVVHDIINSGGLDELVGQSGTADVRSEFGSLSMSRMGYFGDSTIADTLFQTLNETWLGFGFGRSRLHPNASRRPWTDIGFA